MDKFVRDAYDEFRAYEEKIVNNGDGPIMNAVFVKLLLEGKDMEKMSETIVKSGHTEVFSAFVGSLMQVVFHVGYEAGRESMMK